MADDVAAAAELLGRLLEAVERGELQASPAEVGALAGALEVLSSLGTVRDTTV